MKLESDNTPKQIQLENSELEVTREFTPEEAKVLRIYAEWVEHRRRQKEEQERGPST